MVLCYVAKTIHTIPNATESDNNTIDIITTRVTTLVIDFTSSLSIHNYWDYTLE